MTIYRKEGPRAKKDVLRDAKLSALSRKQSSLTSLPPIYETDEEAAETPINVQRGTEFLDRKAAKIDCERKRPQAIAAILCEGKRANNSAPLQKSTTRQQSCFAGDGKETCGYFNRYSGCANTSARSHEGINQAVFPDFFPRGMLVQCAHNALPEARKALYMKTMATDFELKYLTNCCGTNVTTNPSCKQQNWMQFFG